MKIRAALMFSLFCLAAFLFSATSVANAQSVKLTVAPNAITIHPGDQNVPVTVSIGAGTYAGPVVVTLTGLPSGITAPPLTLTAGNSGQLLLSATVSADQEAFPASGPDNPNFAVNAVKVVAIAGTTETTAPLSLTVSLSNPAFAPAPSKINLPIVNINTGGTPVTSKVTDVPGTITITSADGQTSYLPNSSDSDNTGTFHVHGNSTSEMPKLAYNVKLNTSLDLLTAMGMKCPYVTSSNKAVCDKSKSYILLANYDDKTLLRDWAASWLANAIPLGNGYLTSPAGSPTPSGTSTLMPWAPHSFFVELYLNGVYEGNYQLIEKVNVDSHRVNITELTDSDTSGDLSGGYLMEIDRSQGEDFNFITPQKVYVGMVDPDFIPEVPEQTSYIQTYVDNAEAALYGPKFTDPTLGWRAYFDEAAAVNFYIVNDLMANQDGAAFNSSDYFYIAADNPLIYMGPVWDFDISSGNVNYSASVNPTIPRMQADAPWYVQLFKDPSFKADVAKQWNTLKTNGFFTNWLAAVNQEASALEQSQANNFGRWPMQGIKVWPNAIAVGSYDGEVTYFNNFINLRVGYLDAIFNNKAQTFTALTAPAGTIRQGSAVTVSAVVTGGTSPAGTVTFLSNGIMVGTGALSNGSASASVQLPAGSDSLTATYGGDSTNALSVSNPAAVNVLAPLVSSAISLTSSASTATPQTPPTFTVLVAGNSGTATPSGSVSFTANGTPLGGTTLLSNGTATFTPAQLPSGTSTITATYAGDGTFAPSGSNAVTVSSTIVVAAPVYSVAAGTYTKPISLTISDATSGAAIYYTLNGATPNSSSTLYTGPVTVSSTRSFKAVAIASSVSSSVSASTYILNIGPQEFGYSAGTFTATTLSLNGNAKIVGGEVELTDGGTMEMGSAWYPTPVPVTAFTTDFTFQLTNANADGFTLTFQNAGLKSLGTGGGGLGYQSIGKSVAVKFDLFNSAGEGADSTGLYINGGMPTVPATDLTSSGINLHSGDALHAHFVYDGVLLTMTLTDLKTNVAVTEAFTVNIPSIVGGNTAYVGFTAASGSKTAVQVIDSWGYDY